MALLTMFLVSVHTGYVEKRHYLALIVLVLILAVVFFLIIDLDRAHEGLLHVPQLPMINLQRQLNTLP